MQVFLNFTKQYADDILSFVGGELLTISLTYHYIQYMHWLDPILKGIIWIVAGALGGFGSILGKRLFEWIEKKLTKK